MDYNSVSKKEEEGINLETLLIYAKKVVERWWIVAVSAILLAAVGLSVALVRYVPTYSSQIMFIASNRQTSMIVSGQSSSDLNASVTLATSYQYVFTTTELATKVAQNCGYKDITAAQIKSFVSVQTVEDTAIVYLTVTTTNADLSYSVAKTYESLYEDAITAAFPSTTLTVIDPPLMPESPNANRTTVLYTLAGFAAGLVLSVLGIVCAVMLKDTVKSSDEVQERLGLKVIGRVNRVTHKGKNKKGEKSSILITDRKSGFAFIETFKLIRTKIDHISARKNMKAFVVTNTMENEGKTTTAVNIALALAKNGKEVLLIDGDLRKPAVAKSLGINAGDDTGIIGIVEGQKSLADSIKYSEKYNLYLLLNGRAMSDPSELLSTPQAEEIIDRAKQEFDYVIIDTAPSGVLADASILAGFSDGIIMVIRQDVAPLRRIQRAMDNLNNSGTEIVGCIYNDASSGTHMARAYDKHYGYGYGYGHGHTNGE